MPVFVSTEGWGETPATLQQVEKQLAEKLKSSEEQGQRLASITESAQRTLVMQQYFRTTEDILALMLERQRLLQARSRDMPSRGAPGGPLRQHGKDPRMSSGTPSSDSGQVVASMPGSQSEMPSRGAPGGPLRQHGKDPRVSSPSPSEGDMEQLMRALAQHSAYMETIQDQALLAQEILRHQKMLDQMLQLTQ
jgi:hypothetical protein